MIILSMDMIQSIYKDILQQKQSKARDRTFSVDDDDAGYGEIDIDDCLYPISFQWRNVVDLCTSKFNQVIMNDKDIKEP